MSKPKLIVVCGQTATGKSDLAVILARTVLASRAEIVSADSRQVFCGLDIGSGKITRGEMQGVPHHLLDVVNPCEEFNVRKFKELGDKTIFGILGRSKTPILVGGTGYYIESIVDDLIPPEVSPNVELRKKLEALDAEKLFEYLKNIDPVYSEKVDRNNPRRLIRAIEIAKAFGSVPPLAKNERFDVLMIGLELPDDELREKINKRLVQRIEAGMIEEVEKLHTDGASWKWLEALGLEYRYVAEFLQNKMTKDEMIEILKTKIWHYAKRQKTWFKRDKRIKWFHPSQVDEIKKEVSHFLF